MIERIGNNLKDKYAKVIDVVKHPSQYIHRHQQQTAEHIPQQPLTPDDLKGVTVRRPNLGNELDPYPTATIKGLLPGEVTHQPEISSESIPSTVNQNEQKRLPKKAIAGILLLALAAGGGLYEANNYGYFSENPTPTNTVIPTETSTSEALASTTSTPVPTNTSTETPSPTFTPTETATATATIPNTPTPTPHEMESSGVVTNIFTRPDSGEIIEQTIVTKTITVSQTQIIQESQP